MLPEPLLVLRYFSKIGGIAFRRQGKVDFQMRRCGWFKYSIVMSRQGVTFYFFSPGLNSVESVRGDASAAQLLLCPRGLCCPEQLGSACAVTHSTQPLGTCHGSPAVTRNYTAVIPVLRTVHKSQSKSINPPNYIPLQ